MLGSKLSFRVSIIIETNLPRKVIFIMIVLIVANTYIALMSIYFLKKVMYT